MMAERLAATLAAASLRAATCLSLSGVVADRASPNIFLQSQAASQTMPEAVSGLPQCVMLTEAAGAAADTVSRSLADAIRSSKYAHTTRENLRLKRCAHVPDECSPEDQIVGHVIALDALVRRALIQRLKPLRDVGVAGVVPQVEAPHDRQIGTQALQGRRVNYVCQAELPAGSNGECQTKRPGRFHLGRGVH